MLCLSRREGETICIGEDITVTVVEISGGQVRLGISAPKHIPVHRQEVYDAIRSQTGDGSGGRSTGPAPTP